MDLFKAITGKNPAEYEQAAKILVEKPDIDLFKKLVKQDDFLFDFVKINVAMRIQHSCNESNYKNLLLFTNFYSASYDTLFAEIFHQYGDDNDFETIKSMYYNGTESQKAYAAKYFLFTDTEKINDIISELRKNSESDFEPLAANSIEILSKLNDDISKNSAMEKLDSEDEFEQYKGIKFLVTYQAKDQIERIIKVMKNSSLSENIACEIPYLFSLDELLLKDYESAILVICNILNAIPEILNPASVLDYNLFEIIKNLKTENYSSVSALCLLIAKNKFSELAENEEYLFDCDKNTKDEIYRINEFLNGLNTAKLTPLIYEELYEESDFVFFAVDYADNIEELETLLDSSNQTLILKVLTKLKEMGVLTQKHKETALNSITNDNIKSVVEVL